jgi:hypothetical protein
MSRYKGRASAKLVEQDYPYHIDMIVPPGGLGNRLDAVYEFHTRHGIRAHRGQGSHNAERTIIRWCFADPEIARAFAADFLDVVALGKSHKK